MASTTDLSVLKINYLTQAQYDSAKSQGTLEANEIYMTPVTNPGVEDVEVDGVSVVTDGVAEITMPTVPTKVSQLQNDSGFIAGYTETDPTVPSWAKESDKPSYTASEVSYGASSVQAALDGIKIKNFSSFADIGLDATATVNDVFTAMPAYSRISISLASTATIATELGFADGGVIDILKMNDWRGQAIATSYSSYKTKVGNILAQNRMYWRTMGVLELSVAAFSSLPQTVTNSAIYDDMVCIKAELGTPSAQMGDWTITTSNGSLTISGSISGSTTAKLYLAVKA